MKYRRRPKNRDTWPNKSVQGQQSIAASRENHTILPDHASQSEKIVLPPSCKVSRIIDYSTTSPRLKLTYTHAACSTPKELRLNECHEPHDTPLPPSCHFQPPSPPKSQQSAHLRKRHRDGQSSNEIQQFIPLRLSIKDPTHRIDGQQRQRINLRPDRGDYRFNR